MVKSQEVRIFFLSIVYLAILLFVVMPHHHHEETACYTTSHCTDGIEANHLTAKVVDEHHHDTNNGEESENCISLEYYLVPNSNKNIKQISVPLLIDHGHHFLFACSDCFEEDTRFNSHFDFSNQLTIENSYIVFVRQNIPLRAPPVCLV